MKRIHTRLKTNKANQVPSYWLISYPIYSSDPNHKHNGTLTRTLFAVGNVICRWQNYSWRSTVPKLCTSEFGWCDLLLERLQPKRPLFVLAHNIGQLLTASGFWNLIDNGSLHLEWLCDNDPPTIVRCSNKNGRMILLDMRNWFRGTLPQLVDYGARLSGLTHQQINQLRNDPANCIAAASMLAATWGSWLKLITLEEFGNFAMTAPSQAWHLFRHRTAPVKTVTKTRYRSAETVSTKTETVCDIKFHGNHEIIDTERHANFFGESACYFVGDITTRKDHTSAFEITDKYKPAIEHTSQLYILDCNALFASVMQSSAVPVELKLTHDNIDRNMLRELLDSYCVVASVRINSDSIVYPIRRYKRVLWAIGEFDTVLCSPDLKQAIDNGHIHNVKRVHVYKRAPLLQDIATTLIDYRLRYKACNDKLYETLAKWMINSVYGRFAQRQDYWQHDDDIPCRKRWGRWIEYNATTNDGIVCRSIGGYVQKRLKETYPKHCFPAVAAEINAVARQLMRRYVSIAGPCNCYYYSIDSIIVNADGYRRLVESSCIDSYSPGLLRVQRIPRELTIRDVGNMTIDGQDFLPGLPANAMKTGPLQYQIHVNQSLDTLLANKPTEILSFRSVTLDYNRRYSGRKIMENGWTAPLSVL